MNYACDFAFILVGLTPRQDTVDVPVSIKEGGPTNIGDPWSSIENGDVRSALIVFIECLVTGEVFYKKGGDGSVVKEKHYLKNKIKRICDGFGAERVEMHARIPKGIKRRENEDRQVKISMEPKKSRIDNDLCDEKQESANIFANLINKEKEHTRPSLSDDIELNGLESDVSINDEEFETIIRNTFATISDVEEELEDEMEDEQIELEEEEEREIMADEFHVEPEDIERVIVLDTDPEGSIDEEDVVVEEMEDEEEMSENQLIDESEFEDQSDEESIVSDQDASSDGEANLGEDRECGKFIKKVPNQVPDFTQLPFTDEDSSVTATRAFGWMINSCDVQTFFEHFFQSNALVVKRNCRNYYGNLFSTNRFVKLLEDNYVEYGSNVNIAEYKNGVRKTLNDNGRVYPNQLKEHLQIGRSVQLVNPQTFDDHIWYLCEILQELFGCFVGANSYLTPAGSSGFAPHWDDIDAFLLQLEGKKYWKVYAPDSEENELPRDSSGNFTNEDMADRKPTFEGWIEAGDMLYIPRGFIHQVHYLFALDIIIFYISYFLIGNTNIYYMKASTAKDVHSLHVTISTGSRWAFADLMDKLVPEAITNLANTRWKMRKSLPIGMLDMKGVAELDYRMDELFEEKWKTALDRHMSMLRNAVFDVCDGGIDMMAREFLRTALPPMLTREEKSLSVLGSDSDILSGKSVVFHGKTRVKLIRRHTQRLVFATEDECFIVHRMSNSRLYGGRPEQQFELPTQLIDGFIALSNSYPEWISLNHLPNEMSKKEKQALCSLLYHHCLLMVCN
uniref:Bifunctional lysine-specific demethylase and histidyl-hydroxylase n=1 Tax=Heterorhabditis bacteriophora TaxID=37862 RepID=A0A1I7XM49_HETBA